MGTPSGRSDTPDISLKKASEELEKKLLERAALGDVEVLKDAHATGKAALYGRALDALVESCASSAERLRSLASYITHDEELRANPTLAARLLEAWEHDQTRGSTVELLHVAALSDDAATFERALEAILRAWEDGRLNVLSAGELRSLFDGEYWLLSSGAKSSGAGFALKQKLADARRRLSEGARRETPPTAAELSSEASAQREIE